VGECVWYVKGDLGTWATITAPTSLFVEIPHECKALFVACSASKLVTIQLFIPFSILSANLIMTENL